MHKNCAIIYVRNAIDAFRKALVQRGDFMSLEILDFVMEYLGNLHISCRKISPPFYTLIDYDLGLRKSILKVTEERKVGKEAGLLEPDTIFYLTDRFLCHYGVMDIPGEMKYLLIGPFLVDEVRPEQIYRIIEKNQLPRDFYWQLEQYYRESTTPTSVNSIFSLINQLGENLYGKDKLIVRYIEGDYMEVWEDYFSNYELQIPAAPALSMKVIEERYKYENLLLDAVYKGNTSQALGMAPDSLPNIGKRLKDELRDSKNLLITMNTLLRKEAERACVHPWHIDRYSNSNVVQIEQIVTVDEADILYRKIIKGYCEMVQKHSLRAFSQLTQKMINAIDADLTQDLSLKTFAEQLNVNASYLSGLFKNDTGTALTEYVNKRRMHQARKLLQTTALTVQDIATQVGVPDVHYFNRLFKRDCGMAPREYRSSGKQN